MSGSSRPARGGAPPPGHTRGAAARRWRRVAMRTQVGIVGAGPAGLVLAHLLAQAGVESVVIEQRSREYIEKRVRAGLLEHATVRLLAERGLGERMLERGSPHRGAVPYRVYEGDLSHAAYVEPSRLLVRDVQRERLCRHVDDLPSKLLTVGRDYGNGLADCQPS